MTQAGASEEDSPLRPLWVDVTILSLATVVFVTMLGLGTWQVQRLGWKLDLIETVEARAFGDPVAAPFGTATEGEYAYLRVTTEDGVFMHDLSQRVKALTELGAGSWLMTPLQTDSRIIWINRGFVPSGSSQQLWSAPEGTVSVTGLLRVTEPEGTVLEKNDPSAGRWFSRDVLALSDDAGLGRTATYFVDADHSGAAEDWPRGGLTQVTFRNSHLSYALTWYAMALLFLGGMIYVVRDRLRPRAGGETPTN
ncbi:MAG: SURF1 family protein [Pseudomonadota bacterium]